MPQHRPSRRHHHSNRAIPFLGLVLLILTSNPAAAVRLDELIEIWHIPDYPGVLPKLLEYRKGPYGRNVQVDYMIATSLCRMPDKQELGRKYFQRILAAYALSEENRQQIQREQARCDLVLSSEIEKPTLVALDIGHSDVGVRGKTFYWLDQQNGPLGGDPIRQQREIPQAELDSRLFTPGEQTAALNKVREVAGPDFQVTATERFMIATASGQSHEEMQAIGRHLEQAMHFFNQAFGMPLPDFLVTIYLAPEQDSFLRMAQRIHGLGLAWESIGYSFRDDYSIAGIVRGAHTGTLKHELFHLMARNRFGDIPPWLDEGMAALYEVSRRDGERIEGLQNWRGDVLRRFWDQRPSVGEMVQMDWRTFDAAQHSREQQAANHAMARYFVLYLQEKGELSRVYRTFQQQAVEELTGDTNQDNSGLLQVTLDKPLAWVDEEFAEWFQSLERPLTLEAMKTVQRRLNDLGFNAGKVDGLLGNDTERAIRAFQRSEGLSQTGRLDTTTFELLKARAGDGT